MIGSVINRTARKEFSLGERFTCGVVLTGQQVKSVRAGKINLSGSYARLLTGGAKKEPELWMVGAHIDSADDSGAILKLLVTQKELSQIIGMLQAKRQTLVVVRGFFHHGFFKIELAVAKRLQAHDKREAIRRADMDRQAQAALRR